MTVKTLLRLALVGGRTDRLRFAMTVLGAALACLVILAAVTVQLMPPTEVDDGTGRRDMRWRYTSWLLNVMPLRPWLVLALLALTIPALVLAGQSARLGAPARDRRLATIRLAGASPGQTRLVAAVETVVAGLVGALAGVGAYHVIRVLAGRPVVVDPNQRFIEAMPTDAFVPPEYVLTPEVVVSGHPTPLPLPSGYVLVPPNPEAFLPQPQPEPLLRLPTDAPPPGWVFAVVLVAVPVIAGLLAAIAMRRVVISPLAVVRRARTRRLRWWPLAVVAAGFALLGVHLSPRGIGDPDIWLPLTAWGAVLLMAVGVALSATPLGQLTARAALANATSPALRLAARCVLADPWTGSRSLALLLVGVLVGAASVQGLTYARARPGVVTTWPAEGFTHGLGQFAFALTIGVSAAGLLVATIEGLLGRRRTLVTLVAAGTPRGLLARAVVWQTMLPALPSIALALVVGVLAATLPRRESLAVGVPWVELFLLAATAIGALLLASALSMSVLRASTDLMELRTE